MDDRSTDETLEYLLQLATTRSQEGVLTSKNLLTPACVCTLLESSRVFPHVKVIRQQHGGRISMCRGFSCLGGRNHHMGFFFLLYHYIPSE